MRRHQPYLFLLTLAWALIVSWLAFQPVCAYDIPPAPTTYFTDYTGTIDADTAKTFEQRLAQFERDSSVQIIAVMFPNLPGDAVLEDYTVKTANAWKVGQKGKDNGVVLFIFKNDHKMRIEVGKGMEGGNNALLIPDAIAARIIRNEIVPFFKTGDFKTGITRGLTCLMQASKGEYKGTGQTHAEANGAGSGGLLVAFFSLPWYIWLPILIIVLILFVVTVCNDDGTGYSSGGGYSGGGGWSSGGGGSGFSGGGGGFSGGGASGGW